MMQIFQELWKETSTNVNNRIAFKTNITLALDGSEDHLASTKLINLIVKNAGIQRAISV